MGNIKFHCRAAMIMTLLWCCSVAGAVEIKGTVRSGTKDGATIAIEGESMPNVGDVVDIYFKLPGAEEEINVGSGKVIAVGGDSVEAKIDQATGTLSKDQLARITSDNPQKRSATTVAAAASPAEIAQAAGASSPPPASSPTSAFAAANIGATSASPTQFRQEANALYDRRDYDGAIPAYTKAIEANPNDAIAYFNRATCYGLKSDWARSMDDLNTAISIDPNFARAYSQRTRVRVHQQDYGPALLEDCNKALALDGNDAAAYLQRGTYYAHEGAMKLAEADWKKAIALDPAMEEFVKQNRAFFGTSRKESRRRKR